MNGKPIKNPVLDPRVVELYSSERVICVIDMAALVIERFPEQRDKIEESMSRTLLSGNKKDLMGNGSSGLFVLELYSEQASDFLRRQRRS